MADFSAISPLPSYLGLAVSYRADGTLRLYSGAESLVAGMANVVTYQGAYHAYLKVVRKLDTALRSVASTVQG